MEISKKASWKIFGIAAGCILLYWLIGERQRFELIVDKISSFAFPFVFGSVLAFILNVPMRWIERQFKAISHAGLRRVVAVLLTIILVLIVIAGVFLLLIPQMSDTAEMLIPKLTSFAVALGEKVNQVLEDNPQLTEWLAENTNFETFNWSELAQRVIGIVGNSVSKLLLSTFSVIGIVMDLFIGVVFAIYCLFQKENLARQGRKVLYAFLPEKTADYLVRVMRLSNSTFSNFLAGQFIEVIILGVMFAIAMTIFGMPYIPLVSVLIAVTAFIPIVGTWAGCILGAFLIFVADPMLAVWFVIMFIIIQQIENNLIYPKVVGTSIGLSGMWVLLAVGIGGQLMGVAGMFLMIPIVSVFYTLVQEHTNHRLHLREIDADKLQVQPPDIAPKVKLKKKPNDGKKSSKKKANNE